jgi:hypothetical protein
MTEQQTTTTETTTTTTTETPSAPVAHSRGESHVKLAHVGTTYINAFAPGESAEDSATAYDRSTTGPPLG